jgi:integrase
VALIIGMCAQCRRHELASLKVDEVKVRDDVIVISILETKTKRPRTNCITEPLWIGLIKKYISLRPPNLELRRFFLYYANNKCTRQPVGIHSFGKMPSKIAAYLKLPNAIEYTGHCFCRSSATLLAGEGADITTIKRHGNWKSTAVAEGYIEDSLKAKIALTNQLVARNTSSFPAAVASTSSSSFQNIVNEHQENTQAVISEGLTTNLDNLDVKLKNSVPNINFSQCTRCTINVNFK